MKNIVNETEKVHDETLQLMLKAQELMNEKMMHYEQIKAHIENDGDKIFNSEGHKCSRWCECHDNHKF